MTWWLLPCDRRHQRPELRADERQSGLVSHCVLGKRRLFELPVDSVAVERGRERHAVLQFRSRRAVRSCSADMPGARGCEMNAASRDGLSTRSGKRALEVDVASAI